MLIVPSVSADYLDINQITETYATTEKNPSIAINEVDNTIWFTHTVQVGSDDYSAIYLTNNTEPISGDEGAVQGIPGFYSSMIWVDSLYPGTVKFNDYSEVDVNSNSGEVWVVYQGQVEGESDTEIFLYYSNSTFKDTIRLTDDSDDDTKPDIVALNDSKALVVWENEAGGGEKSINYVTMDHNVSGTINSFGGSDGIDQSEPVLDKKLYGTNEVIHLSYINGTDLMYDNVSVGEAFDITNSIASGPTFANISIDSSGDYVMIAYSANGNVGYHTSNDRGVTFGDSNTNRVAEGSDEITEIDCYITDFGDMEIIYTRLDSSLQWNVYSANTYTTGGGWVTDELLIGGTDNNRNFQAIAEYNNNTVIGMFAKSIKSSNWEAPDFYMFGYELFYKKSASAYNEFGLLNESPNGNYLIEGLDIVYAGSDSEIDLNVTYTDRTTGLTYSNLTTIEDAANLNFEYLWWHPGSYMITKGNRYDLIITFDGTGNEVIQIPINPSELAVTHGGSYVYTYNLSSDNYPMGKNCPYTISISVKFDFSGKFIKSGEGSTLGTFDTDNYADFGIISMTKDDWYNFTFTTDAAGANAYLFPSSTQLFDPDNALVTWNHTLAGKTTKTNYQCESSGNYFVLIENRKFETTIDYFFEYERAPKNVTLTSPNNNVVYNWDTTKFTTLKWSRNSADTDLQYYKLQISNQSDFGYIVDQQTFVAALTSQYTFTTPEPEKWYYWRVKAIDNDGNTGQFDQEYRFSFDSVTPGAPTFTDTEQFFTVETFDIEWTEPTDGIFEVEYYNVYRSLDPDFTPGVDNMITDAGDVTDNELEQSLDRNDRYYYYVEAVDQVGHTSALSNKLEVIYSYGGAVDATTQTDGFQGAVGDTLEYRVTYVESSTVDSLNNPLMTYRNKQFVAGTKFHFWLQDVDKNDVIPVRGDWYSYAANNSARDYYYLEEEDLDLTMFVTNKNETYQELVYNLTITNMLSDLTLGTDLKLTKYYSTWRGGMSDVKNTVCYTYATPVDSDRLQTSVTFVVDKKTGVLLEMVFYDNDNEYGYSLRLLTTTVNLSSSAWSWSPIAVPIFIGGVAAVVYAVLKKLEL